MTDRADPHYAAHYVYHRTKPVQWVTSEEQKDRLCGNLSKGMPGEGYQVAYVHQAFPVTRYHKSYDPAVDRFPDDLELHTSNADPVASAKLTQAKIARDRQRATKVKTVPTPEALKVLSKDWVEYDQLPKEIDRVKREADPFPEPVL